MDENPHNSGVFLAHEMASYSLTPKTVRMNGSLLILKRRQNLWGYLLHCTRKPMLVLFLRLSNPQTNTPRNDIELLSVTKKSG
jgi:hypothetical protein